MKLALKLTFGVLFSIFSVQAQIPEKATDISPLLIGEYIPDAQLQNMDGDSANLNDILKEKHTVLVFFRGGWCPFCNLQLYGLSEIQDSMLSLGFQIVAISPDNYKNLKHTVSGKVDYRLFSDPGGKLISDIGIAYKITNKTISHVEGKLDANSDDIMPVPTVMIVNTNSEILFEYINMDYKIRITPELLLAVLQNIDKN